MAHRIVLDPTTPTRFLSCGEDGKVFAFDTRTAAKRLLFQVSSAICSFTQHCTLRLQQQLRQQQTSQTIVLQSLALL
jgi:hypothetical protein